MRQSVPPTLPLASFCSRRYGNEEARRSVYGELRRRCSRRRIHCDVEILGAAICPARSGADHPGGSTGTARAKFVLADRRRRGATHIRKGIVAFRHAGDLAPRPGETFFDRQPGADRYRCATARPGSFRHRNSSRQLHSPECDSHAGHPVRIRSVPGLQSLDPRSLRRQFRKTALERHAASHRHRQVR